jgi:hypothetical protein
MTTFVRTQLAFAPNSVWKAGYQRNNKASGHRNLKCFPMCPPVGHQQSFCGTPIVVDFDLELAGESLPRETLNNLVCFGHFLSEDEDGIKVGDTIAESLSRQMTRGQGMCLSL